MRFPSAVTKNRSRRLNSSEIALLKLLETGAAGYSRAAIAKSLGVTERTVKRRLLAAYKKLGASAQMEAVTRAKELGFIHRDATSLAVDTQSTTEGEELNEYAEGSFYSTLVNDMTATLHVADAALRNLRSDDSAGSDVGSVNFAQRALAFVTYQIGQICGLYEGQFAQSDDATKVVDLGLLGELVAAVCTDSLAASGGTLHIEAGAQSVVGHRGLLARLCVSTVQYAATKCDGVAMTLKLEPLDREFRITLLVRNTEWNAAEFMSDLRGSIQDLRREAESPSNAVLHRYVLFRTISALRAAVSAGRPEPRTAQITFSIGHAERESRHVAGGKGFDKEAIRALILG